MRAVKLYADAWTSNYCNRPRRSALCCRECAVIVARPRGAPTLSAPARQRAHFTERLHAAVAEAAGFEILPTTDKNILYQQNLKGRKIAFVVLGNQQWPTLRRYIERVVAAVEAATQGGYTEVDIPLT